MDERDLHSVLLSVSTLRDLSVIAVASLLCHHLNIKNKIKTLLDKHHPAWRRTKNLDYQYRNLIRGEYLTQMFQEISSIFWKELKRWKIPRILKLEVHEKALELTERIHDWTLHLISDLELDRIYIKKIYFTTQGEIDVDKIFKSNWMNFPKKKPMQYSFFDKRIKTLHYLACAFFQEEYIITNQAKIMKEINSINFCLQQEDNCTVFNTMKHVIYNLGKRYLPLINDFQTNPLPKLMKICTLFGFYKAFIYFWNRCNESQKLNYFEKIFFYGSWYGIKYDLKAYYATDNLFKIITFLIDQMNESQKNQLLVNFAGYLDFCLGESKCWQKFCIRMVDRYLPFISESEAEAKFLIKVFENFDFSLLKIVIDHDIYKRKKNYVLKFGQEKYKKLITENNFKSLDEFLDNVFKTEHEKNHFKKEFNFLQEFISSNRWENVEKVLNWMRTLSKNDKRNLIVEELKNSSSRTRWEIEKLLQKFLKWYSDTVMEPLIEYCEDQSSLKDLTCEIVYILWFRFYSKLLVVNISSEILKSVFHERKEIRILKKTELAKDVINVLKLFCDKKLELKGNSEVCFSVFEEFLKFCGAFDKLIQVKTSIAENIGDWIVEYGVGLRRFDIIVPLLDWIYGSENDNRELLKNYFEKSEEVENYFRNRKL